MTGIGEDIGSGTGAPGHPIRVYTWQRDYGILQDRIKYSLRSEHGEREGEAHTALPGEGAT